MANNYLFTLLLFILLLIGFSSTNVLSTLEIAHIEYVFMSLAGMMLLYALYGFTNAVKVNVKAKVNSYIFAVISIMFAAAIVALCLYTQTQHFLTLTLAGLCILSSIRLIFVTYKKTKSYFI